MKKILILLALSAGLVSFTKQTVPDAVKQAFAEKFPDVKNGKWEREANQYEVNFKQHGQPMSATFMPNGEWLETETSIAISALPAAVKQYLDKNYPGQQIKEAAILQTPKGARYEAEVSGKDVLFDQEGHYLSTSK